MADALSIRNLSHDFEDRTALDGVSFDIAEGSLTVLLGVNGAGKTTLFNLVTRLYPLKIGQISICGHDLVEEPREALAKLGIVFQAPALDRMLTVAQNLRYAAALYGIGRRAADARAADLMAELEIDGLADRRVGSLSGGQAQRAEIARALMHHPRLLLCDEATAGLDIRARRALVDEVHRLAAEEGIGVLWSTHLTEEIRDEDPVVVLHEGRVLARESAAKLAAGQPIDRAFLSLIEAAA